MTAPIDSIPRITVHDLVMALRQFESDDVVTLENLRLKFCYDRKATRRGDYMFPTVVAVAGELQKLGIIDNVGLPKAAKKAYDAAKAKPLRISSGGRELLTLFNSDKAEAYDQIFSRMYSAHRSLRAFVAVISSRNVFAPVATSVKDHVGCPVPALTKSVADGTFDVAETLRLLTQRLGRALTDAEATEIRVGIEKLVKESALSAANEEAAEFAKNFLAKLNDVIVPAIFRSDGLPFDYRTHRTIWALGPEFKVWGTTTSHPEYNGTLVYRTATVELSSDGEQVQRLAFDSGLKATQENFLAKLYTAYQKLQSIHRSNLVNAWELRAVFCVDNRCQQSVFNRLFEDHYQGSELYSLHFEIQQTKSREEPLRAGNRAVGTILMTETKP